MTFIALAFVLIIGFVAARKVIELSSDPKAEKDFFPDIHNKTVEIKDTALPFVQLGGTINDASGVNRVAIYGIVGVITEDDIKRSLCFASQQGLKVSIGGARHSMGGQAFAADALVLDMRGFNRMSVDVEKKTLTVQSGAIWHDIQDFLNPYNLSVKAMQSIDVPTVGGTISVNAHGMDHRIGGIASTILSMRLMLADGSIQMLNKSRDHELFQAAIGGYGLIGVILEVELDLMDNLSYTEEEKIIKTKDFLPTYQEIERDKDCHMFYARLSTAPSSFLQEMIVYSYMVCPSGSQARATLVPESHYKLRRFVFNLGRKSPIGREIKWFAEKHIQPFLQTYPASRNQIMHRSYVYLKNNIKNNTDVLQEYFLPKSVLLEFIDELGKILKGSTVVARNVEIRSVYREGILLDYAKEDWFGVVLYINFDLDEIKAEQGLHSQLINLSQKLGGSFYLPYRLSATKEQIKRAYPNFETFLQLKKKYDPKDLLTSMFYETYK